jgi:hypothetical protein
MRELPGRYIQVGDRPSGYWRVHGHQVGEPFVVFVVSLPLRCFVVVVVSFYSFVCLFVFVIFFGVVRSCQARRDGMFSLNVNVGACVQIMRRWASLLS